MSDGLWTWVTLRLTFPFLPWSTTTLPVVIPSEPGAPPGQRGTSTGSSAARQGAVESNATHENDPSLHGVPLQSAAHSRSSRPVAFNESDRHTGQETGFDTSHPIQLDNTTTGAVFRSISLTARRRWLYL